MWLKNLMWWKRLHRQSMSQWVARQIHRHCPPQNQRQGLRLQRHLHHLRQVELHWLGPL